MPDASAVLGLDLARLHVQAVDALEAAGHGIESENLAEAAYTRLPTARSATRQPRGRTLSRPHRAASAVAERAGLLDDTDEA